MCIMIKNYFTILLVCAFLFFTLSIIWYMNEIKVFDKDDKVLDKDDLGQLASTNPLGSDINNSSDKNIINSTNTTNKVISDSNNLKDSSNSTPEEVNDLPKDLYTNACGYYYGSYGVCNGTCPEGVCQSEGRSCYCKK
jgi:hypothetical protein